MKSELKNFFPFRKKIKFFENKSGLDHTKEELSIFIYIYMYFLFDMKE